MTLLGAGIHPKLSKTIADACAVEIASEADTLEAAVTAGRETGAKVKVLSRVRTALGKVVHTELMNLKRSYKVEGFCEAEIHAVIPDRPVKTKKAGATGQATVPKGIVFFAGAPSRDESVAKFLLHRQGRCRWRIAGRNHETDRREFPGIA